jgi:hypothetical protein
MRRRRQALRVSTFPFLAVLLCAMGALLFVLLVMDRKARLAVQAKAREEAFRRLEDQVEALAARRSQYESKKRLLTQVWEKKRDALMARVSAEEVALHTELLLVQARLAKAARRVEDEEGNVEKLRKQLQDEQARLLGQQRALEAARKEAVQVSARQSVTDHAKTQLVARLIQLEKSLKDLQEARQRDANTYSVIPYFGKHGESRRPLYVECAAAGILFHPDKLQLDGSFDPSRVREELKRRAAEQSQRMAAEGAKGTRPFVMLLVRPNGIGRFYQMQSALHDLSLEFGYEFVDADWILQVPTDGPAPPKLLATPQPASRPPRSAPGGRLPLLGPGLAGGGGGVPGAPGGAASGGGPGWTGVGSGGTTGRPGSGGLPGVPGMGGGGGGSTTGVAGVRAPGGAASGGGSGWTGIGTGGTAGRPGAGGAVPGIGGVARGSATGVSGTGAAGGGPTGAGSVAAGPGNPGSGGGGSGNGLFVANGGGPANAAAIPLVGGSGGSGMGSSGGLFPSGSSATRMASAAPSGTNPFGPVGSDSSMGGGGGSSTSSGIAGSGGTPGGGGMPGSGGSPGSGGTLGSAGMTGSAASGTGTPGAAGAGGSGVPGNSSSTLSPPAIVIGLNPPAPATSDPSIQPLPGSGGAGSSGSGSPGAGTAPGGGVSASSGGVAVAGGIPAQGNSLPAPAIKTGVYESAPPIPPVKPLPGTEQSTSAVAAANGPVIGGRPGGGGGGSGQGEPSSGIGPALPAPPAEDAAHHQQRGSRPAPVLRPARLGSDNDYLIFIECLADQALIYPSRRRVGIDSLNHSTGFNQLFKTVEQMIARRLSTLLPGETPPRIQVRFLVHSDGERTFHLAYPVLDALQIEKVRISLRPEDDVERIISAY